MIRGGELILVTAQIAVSLAGFSGVVAAFTKMRVEDKVRFLMLLGASFFVILFAFVPFLLDLGGHPEHTVWRWSSGLWLVAFAVCAPLIVKGRRMIVAHGTPAPGWSVLLILLVVVLTTLALLGNALGWPYEPNPVPFILALVSGLIGAGAIFVYLVLIRPEDRG